MDGESVEDRGSTIRERLGGRPIVLVGLMGAGKTTVGRRVASLLSLPFVDSDAEIEAVSTMTVPELFEAYGEPEFRALEARVIARLVQDGRRVIATGGGAYMNGETRALLGDKAVTVWLKADLDTLMERVARRADRPLLKASNPRKVMQELMDMRYPVYAGADLTVMSRPVKREVIADELVAALGNHLHGGTSR
ncbi:shikimate kinase [Jiella avicenniae]|uniref:Shikimate kinase n=1 Tax=Jiella avicenniae TaxID=2907202 RepID=A0A9X1P0B2_9HYPH|nr:shikimate kinase [Jiella avicenniae]MCE7027691.1 shikimate kinase [Jiella avicenniae]MCE7028733.1 shikimate kinase [Jiella avicenniae]